MTTRASRIQFSEDNPVSVLTISPEKVFFVIVKAREFDAKDEVTEPNPGSNPSDDRDIAQTTPPLKN
jgi:hypothetical protein